MIEIKEDVTYSELSGVLKCLSVFGEPTNSWCANAKTFVAKDGEVIVGVARLIVVNRPVKGREARIEDVAVLPEFSKKRVGTKLVTHLRDYATKELCCYKVQLTCRPELEEWYASLGFKRHEVNMRFDA